MASGRLYRRLPISLGVSVALHGLVAVVLVGSSLWDAWRTPIDVEITGMSLEDLKDVPLGMPAAGENRTDKDAVIAPPPRAQPAPRKRSETADAEKAAEESKEKHPPGARAAEEDPNGGAAPPRPTSVRSYAPEGSRVTALLRVDRLRGTPYASAVDDLLMHLPDRRDLFDGTGLELLRDFDTILIATPNPLDATVTFLAARHHLTDTGLRSALDRGARATGRKLSWRNERGRPFAERRLAASASGEAAAVPAPASPTRDRRLILLAAPTLVVVTPPAYRSLLLQGRGRLPVRAGATGVGGAGGTAAGAAPETDDTNAWAALVRRIDAEDSVMPPDAVAMVSAADLFSARTLRSALDTVPGTRGAVDDDGRRAPTVMGLPVPRLLSATLGATPGPFANLDAEFSVESDAARWEEEWPKLRHKLLTNPLVVLGGFAPLIRRCELTRSASTAHLHIEATETETKAILNLLATQLTALGR